jgi:glycosyltransferase involved in cell wall biosynthesis
VVLEAMPSGLAVVGSDAGGVPDLVRSGEDGLLLAPDDTAHWVEAIGGLVEDPGRRAELGGRAREAVETTWTWEAATADLRSHYLDLVTERAVAA